MARKTRNLSFRRISEKDRLRLAARMLPEIVLEAREIHRSAPLIRVAALSAWAGLAGVMSWTPQMVGVVERVMRAAGILLCLVIAAAGLAPAGTVVSDTIYTAFGTGVNGRIVIEWPAFTTADLRPVAAGRSEIAVRDGVFLADLEPLDTAIPTGITYSVEYRLSDGLIKREIWLVPTSAIPVSISSVRVSVTQVPASRLLLTQLSSIGAIKGDVIAFGTAWGIQSGGTDGQVLVKDSTAPRGLKWDDVAGGSGAVRSVFGRTGAVVADGGDYSSYYAGLAHAHAGTDITSGVIDSARLPYPGASAKGAILTTECPVGEYATGYDTGGEPVCSAPSGGGGLADPGANGIVKRTALNTTAVATDGTDYVSPSGSATLTNKTFDAEATGNSLTIVDRVSGMFLRGNSSSQTWLVDYGSSGPTVGTSWNAGSDITYLSYAACYCTDADGPCWFSRSVRMPTDWDPSKAVDLSWAWGASGTSGTIVFQVALACRGDGDARAVQYNTATEVLDTNSSSSVLNQVTATGLSTTGCSAGDTLTWRILRDRTHASDTFSGAFSIEGPWALTFRRTQ